MKHFTVLTLVAALVALQAEPTVDQVADVAVSAPVQTVSDAYVLAAQTQEVPGQPYVRHSTMDRFGRRITFYLSDRTDHSAQLPLIVYIQGSGCNSLFAKNGSIIVPVSGHATVADVWMGHGRVLIVEKPGVKFLDSPAGAVALLTKANVAKTTNNVPNCAPFTNRGSNTVIGTASRIQAQIRRDQVPVTVEIPTVVIRDG